MKLKTIHWKMMSSNQRPFPHFITFEGGEGAGKTTLMNSLEKELSSKGIDVVCTREPGGTALGEKIRSWLLEKGNQVQIGVKAELLLFLAARAQHINDVIAPAIKAGKVVLCDRFNDSTIAYQGAGRGLGVPWVTQMCEMICGGITPDLTFYLDVDPAVGLERTRRTAKDTAQAGQVDRIESEKMAFHQTVRQAFLDIAVKYPARFHVLDAHRSKNDVFDAAISIFNLELAEGGNH